MVATNTEELLPLPEAADRLGVSIYTVRRWIKDGKLRAFRPGKEYRVREADLEEFLAAREVRPKEVAPPSQRSLFNGLEEERRATVRDQLASWRGMHEESAARWARALEREPAFDSVDAAAAFCAEVIAEGAVGRTIITRHLIPQVGILLPEDEAAQERQEFLETHAHLEEGMHAVVDLVEGMVDSETDADAASKAIGRYLDQAVSHAVGDTWEERRDRPDFQLWLKRERKRRRKAGAQTKTQSEEGGQKRPTA